MRCDYPMGYDEDYLEPACEVFLQLFLQNAQIAVNEEISQDNEGPGFLNIDIGGYESDDNFSFPSVHTISDGSVSSGSSTYGDEGQDLIVDGITSHFEEISENSFNLSGNEESCSPEESCSSPNVGVPQIITESSTFVHVIPESSSTINSENSDDSYNVAFPESHDSENYLSDDDPSPSNVTPIFQETCVQTDVVAHNIISTTSTRTVYVVVPTTDSPHESDSSLSEVSSDTLLSDPMPSNSSSPSSVMPDNETNLLEHEPLYSVELCHLHMNLMTYYQFGAAYR